MTSQQNETCFTNTEERSEKLSFHHRITTKYIDFTSQQNETCNTNTKERPEKMPFRHRRTTKNIHFPSTIFNIGEQRVYNCRAEKVERVAEYY